MGIQITAFLRSFTFRVILHVGFWLFYLSMPILQYRIFTDFSDQLLLVISLVNIVYVLFYYPFTYYILPKFFNFKKLPLFILGTLIIYIAFFYTCRVVYQICIDSINFSESDLSFINEAYGRPVYYIPEFLQICFVTAIPLSIKFVRRYYRLQDEKNMLAKMNTDLELNFLKSQINPHFLFNTLNNIYSLSLQKSDKAPEMIIKLSDMMRYILYECDVEKIGLDKEVAFMRDYVELEKLRHGQNVQIEFEVEGNLEGKQTPPLLFIHFVENAFKHGVNAQFGKSYVNIALKAVPGSLQFRIENNKPVNGSQLNGQSGGIGLENIKKRLQLIYPGRHALVISDESNIYTVDLTVNT